MEFDGNPEHITGAVEVIMRGADVPPLDRVLNAVITVGPSAAAGDGTTIHWMGCFEPATDPSCPPPLPEPEVD